MTERIQIYEVGPRDGLQNETVLIPTSAKIALIDCLSQAGFQKIEATSFVSPKWVPQLADAAEVMRGITRKAGVDYAALTPNIKGLQGAVDAKADEVAIFGSASESFSQKNINCSVDESLARFHAVMAEAKRNDLPVRGYVSCVIACPYEGAIDPLAVQRVARGLLDMGCYEVSLGDTIGAGTPASVAAMIKAVAKAVPTAKLAGHFHDTRGNAIANVQAAVAQGLRVFDSAIGGLGGCPYAPGAQGNVSTLAVYDALTGAGFETGLARAQLLKAEALVAQIAADAAEKEIP